MDRLYGNMAMAGGGPGAQLKMGYPGARPQM